MLRRSEIINSFRKAIQQGTRYEEPYLLYTFSPFTESLYKKILANLPRDTDYMEQDDHPDAMLPNGRITRLVFPLQPDRIRACLSGETCEFWLELANVLCDTELYDVFKSALRPELYKRLGESLDEITPYPAPMLIRDFSPYKLYIHKDTNDKLITTQYYLPRDNSQKHLGTNIYKREDTAATKSDAPGADARDFAGKYEPFAGKFELIRKLEFTPRTSYCFAVSDYSWHSVDPISLAEPPRNSMMLIYYRVPGIDTCL